MFAALGNSVPRFETRKALLVINMQNDTFGNIGNLMVHEPQDYRERIINMVPYYRRMGDIVWIRTEIDENPSSPGTSSPKNAPTQSSDNQFNETGTAQLSLEDSADDETTDLSHVVDEDTIGQYYPSSRTKAAMRKASAKARAEQRRGEVSSFVQDQDTDGYIHKPRKGQSATVYRTGSYGAEFTNDTIACMDEKKDMVIVKNHYSAFDATPLLMSLRMKLVTHIYLAGSLSNVSIYATAADAVRHGFELSIIEDCIGYLSEARHLDAMRKMADMLGASGVDSEEIVDEAGGRIPPDADEAMFSGPGIDGIRPRSRAAKSSNPQPGLSDTALNTMGQNSDSDTIGSPDANQISSTVESERRKTSDLSAGPAKTQTPESPARKPDRGKWKPRKLGPGDHIGEGDSNIIYDALSDPVAEVAFKLVKNEVQWQAMRHRSGEVPRRVAVQGEIGMNGSIPIYRHPADESPPLLEFTPTVLKIRDELQMLLKQPFNHVLIQLYRSGQDNISEHSDKTLDIARGSNIVNLSLGAQRTMTLRTKRSMYPKNQHQESVPRDTQRIPMPHNSLFVLGCRSNSKWLHGIKADKRPEMQKLEEEKACGGERISLTFRHIGTFTNKDRSKIWGQGATSKFQATADDVSTSDSVEMESMIVAFGKENQQVDFDWDAEYGEGFDVMNLAVINMPPTSTLYLCRDELSNLRVKMAILQQDIPCRMTRSKPDESSGRRSPPARRTIFSLSGDENPLFRDVDANRSETLGDLAILFYISKFYPPEHAQHISEREIHRVASNIFARITQANELLFLWQEWRGTPLNASTRATHQVRRISAAPSSQKPSLQQPSPQQPSPDQQQQQRQPLSTDETLHSEPYASLSHPVEAFESELEVWEEYAEEAGFASGAIFTIVDCAFWPVLDEVVRRWEGWSERRYPHLADYWRKVGAMPATRQALAEMEESAIVVQREKEDSLAMAQRERERDRVESSGVSQRT